MDVQTVLAVVLGISVLSLAVAFVLARHVLAADTGTPEMRTISDAIREGAEAFLSRQYRTIAMLSVVAAAAIFGFYFVNRDVKNIAEMGSGTAFKVTLSFITGALCSAIAGYICPEPSTSSSTRKRLRGRRSWLLRCRLVPSLSSGPEARLAGLRCER